MFDPAILLAAVINGLTMGAVYALVALGLTLIYGVLHIINFAHGSLLMTGLYGAFFLHRFGIDPYLALMVMAPMLFFVGYALQWSDKQPAYHDESGEQTDEDSDGTAPPMPSQQSVEGIATKAEVAHKEQILKLDVQFELSPEHAERISSQGAKSARTVLFNNEERLKSLRR